jgi:hypothetical protein
MFTWSANYYRVKLGKLKIPKFFPEKYSNFGELQAEIIRQNRLIRRIIAKGSWYPGRLALCN